MRFVYTFLLFVFLFSCKGKEEKSLLEFKVELRKPLSEISGIKADGKDIWVITDKPRAVAYNIDLKGKVIKEVTVAEFQAIDVEAVTSDKEFVYIGDVGDNDGDRAERQIIKFAKSKVGTGRDSEVEGELIRFSFPSNELVTKKKKNNYDCESLVNIGDSLYVFTKRREDQQTELFVIPKQAGTYVARSLGLFDCKGLITDAAYNESTKELALIGYQRSHKYPFILLFNKFSPESFSAAKAERIELADKAWEWQLESISYTDDGKVYFACEETPEVKATLYSVKREVLPQLNKK